MIDYVLNVIFGISARIGALTSAVPALHPYVPGLCLTVLALIAIANLRGRLEAGIIFPVPTYVFVASLGGVITSGLWQTFLAGGTRMLQLFPQRRMWLDLIGIRSSYALGSLTGGDN